MEVQKVEAIQGGEAYASLKRYPNKILLHNILQVTLSQTLLDTKSFLYNVLYEVCLHMNTPILLKRVKSPCKKMAERVIVRKCTCNISYRFLVFACRTLLALQLFSMYEKKEMHIDCGQIGVSLIHQKATM